MWLWIVLGIVVVLFFIAILLYNRLVVLRNKKDNEWAQIDVQLKRRADLIPNLVETVKGYAKHESSTFEEVIQARNSLVSAKTPEEEIKKNNELTNAISKLFALAENYPDLKANQNFLSLQNDLKETEDKISMARQFYNDTVLTYNNQVEMVPTNIIASMFGFKKAAFFEVDESEKSVPKVSF
ncbi:MAG TPA: LemA family protein [Candidatus Scybalousia intestinigallinarum]|nr:LemA family protein [Candidatus Scybalousia intestinigallinarum]